MKKILLLALVVSVGLTASAQKTSFGVKLTPALMWNSITNNASIDSLTYGSNGLTPGIGFGPSLKFKFGERFAIGATLLFSWMGNSFTESRPESYTGNKLINNTYNIRTQYASVPIEAEGKFEIVSELKFVLSFGATPAIVTKSKMSITDLNGDVVASDYKAPTSFANLFLNAGAGVEFPITRGVFVSAIAQYNNGIIDAWNDDVDNVYVKTLTTKNHFFAINLGLHIDF